MKLTRLRCPNCGADFENIDLEKGQKIFKCTRLGCGASFIIDQGIKFADIQKAEADKIRQYRNELSSSISPFNRTLAARHAEDILSILPNDYRAKAILSIANSWYEDKRPLENFITSNTECTSEEFEEVFIPMLDHSNYKTWKLLQEALPHFIDDPIKRHEMNELLKIRETAIINETDRYAQVPKDIFICHSSSDNEIVMRVVKALEEDGWKCWISERNMPPDTRQYWEKIEKAISLCDIFLVCCSRNAMLSDPVQRELSLAEKVNIKRLELKLDDQNHTTLFRYFFEGLNWIKLTDHFEASMHELNDAVYHLLQQNDPNIDIRIVNTTAENENSQPIKNSEEITDKEQQKVEKKRIKALGKEIKAEQKSQKKRSAAFAEQLPHWDSGQTIPDREVENSSLIQTQSTVSNLQQPLQDGADDMQQSVSSRRQQISTAVNHTETMKNQHTRKTIKNRLKSWRGFFLFWLLFSLIAAFWPIGFKDYTVDYGILMTIILFIPGVILYTIWKIRNFRPPHWIAWIIELLIITAISGFVMMGEGLLTFGDPGIAIGLILTAVIFILGIIWRTQYRK